MNIAHRKAQCVLLVACHSAFATWANDSPTVMEEVLVTAQKRVQKLIDVPLSMQSFDAGMLEASLVRDLTQLMTVIPGASEGLSISAGQKQYQLRGISGNNVADPTTGYYLDDAAFFIYGQAYAPVGRSFDLARVEVLRGPQSTLYGNGSMGGTVRFITEQPNLEAIEAHARAAWAGTDGGASSYYLDGALNLPLLRDQLGIRLVAGTERLGGYHQDSAGDDDTNEAELDNVRASLLWRPVDSVDVKLLFAHDVVDQEGSASLSSLEPPVAVAREGDFNDRSYDLFAGTVVWETSIGILTSTTTWIDHDTSALFNGPFPIAPNGILQAHFDTQGEALNNETRLTSPADSKSQWLVGLFYSDTESTDLNKTNIPLVLPQSVQTRASEAISLFGEISYPLFDGRFIPLIGLRYFEDERDTQISSASSQPEQQTFESVNPRFNLTFSPDDKSNYYINIAKGFRSGNFNNPDVCALHRTPVAAGGGGLPCEDSVDSDELWSYEVGSKLSLGGGQFGMEATAYFQDWRDVRQVVQYRGLFQDYQVGDAEVYGVDFDLAWSPPTISGLSLRASVNWNQAEFASLDEDIARASGMRAGDRIPLVPEWTLSLIGNYYWPVTGAWLGQVNVGYSHVDEQFGQFGTLEAGDSRDLLRARVGVDNERVGVWLFGSNLLGEDGAIYVQNPAQGLSFFTQDYPRQLGIEVTYRY